MTDFTQRDLDAGFARLQTAVSSLPLPTSELLPSARDSAAAEVGDVWTLGIADDLGDVEPLVVVLLEKTSVLFEAATVWRAAPVFNEIELATEEDAVLPRRALGTRAGVAMGCEAPMASSHFRRLIGQLSREWSDKLIEFRGGLDDSSAALPEGFKTGVPVVHPDDPALKFHEDLVARLEPVMLPLLEEVFSPEAIAPPATTSWLKAEWRRWVEAAKAAGDMGREGIAEIGEWVQQVTTRLDEPKPAFAGFLADDGARPTSANSAIEYLVPECGALILLVREVASSPEWMLQVLDDPGKGMEGAEILDLNGQCLATVSNGLSSHPFVPDNGWLLVRLVSGQMAVLERNEA